MEPGPSDLGDLRDWTGRSKDLWWPVDGKVGEKGMGQGWGRRTILQRVNVQRPWGAAWAKRSHVLTMDQRRKAVHPIDFWQNWHQNQTLVYVFKMYFLWQGLDTHNSSLWPLWQLALSWEAFFLLPDLYFIDRQINITLNFPEHSLWPC